MALTTKDKKNGVYVDYHTAYTDTGTGNQKTNTITVNAPTTPYRPSGTIGGVLGAGAVASLTGTDKGLGPARTITGGSGSGSTDPAVDAAALYGRYLDKKAQVDSTYGGQSARLKENLDAMNALYAEAAARAQEAQRKEYEYNLGMLDRQAVENQRGLYVNMMEAGRRMNQMMAAQGIGGGAAESALARARNNYLSEQAALSRALQDNQSALAQVYQQALAQIEQERLAGEADALGAYQSGVGNLGAAYLAALQQL